MSMKINRLRALAFVYHACTHSLALRYSESRPFRVHPTVFHAVLREARDLGWVEIDWGNKAALGRLTVAGEAYLRPFYVEQTALMRGWAARFKKMKMGVLLEKARASNNFKGLNKSTP